MKRARESSNAEQKQKVRRSSGASEASTDSKKRGRDFEVTSSKKPSKSPKSKAAAEVKDRSPSPQKQISVEQQRLNAQNWAAQALPSAKKTAAKKSEAKTPSSDKKVSEKKNSSKKTTVATKKESPAPSPSKNKTRTTRTDSDAASNKVVNASNATSVTSGAKGFNIGDVVRLLVAFHGVAITLYLFRLMRPKGYIFPLPLEAFVALAFFGFLHMLSFL